MSKIMDGSFCRMKNHSIVRYTSTGGVQETSKNGALIKTPCSYN